MSDPIIVHELPPSPNNLKVRLALGYKGLSYERKILDLADFPGDRSAVVQASSQPLTPTLEYRGVSIFDSGAIMRFLDANFRDTPRLFSENYQEMQEIERWEWFARSNLGEPIGMIFGAAQEPDKHPGVGPKASALMNERTADIEAQLSKTPFLVGARMTAADVTAVPLVMYAMLPEAAAAMGPIKKFFYENLTLGEGRERTRAWVGKVLAFDPHPPLAESVEA